MKTKEEILEEKMIGHNNMWKKSTVERIGEAMDEYAKQQAIAFDDWTAHHHVKYQAGHKWVCDGKIYDQPPTTEQIYAQFENESQNKGK